MSSEKNLPVILVVDDEPIVLETFSAILDGEFKVLRAQGGKEALEKVAKEAIDLVFLDIKMPDIDGLQVLRRIKEYDNNLSVIMATAADDAKTAVEAMRLGAYHYITKPFDVNEVTILARKAIERGKLLKEVAYFRSQKEVVRFDNIIGKSEKMNDIYKIVEKVARNDATILIFGESGTGKEMIARALHSHSARGEKPFIAVNCASIPENLIESELFGHEKGAFTDAVSQKLGMFELANEGTILLDEISDLRLNIQAKLLRVLEEREIRRVGGTKVIKVDVRIISATNVDLASAMREGRFRKDLYYRLDVVPIELPPLRHRKEDIPLLAKHFLTMYNKAFKKEIKGFTEEAIRRLIEYQWPGNVRELKNIIERLVALTDEDVIADKDLPFDIFIKTALAKNLRSGGSYKEALRDFEKEYIETILEKTNGNKAKTARILGLHRNALFNKVKKLGIQK
ncbi:MAG: sigma-54 dependent transcriptional regulator [Candidatus Omnitrophota bacterium]